MRVRRQQRSDLELFMHHYFAHEPREWSHADKPDLLIKIGDRVVGVEHTRIYNEKRHAQEAVQHHIVDAAWQEHSRISQRKLWLLVDFEDVTKYSKRDTQTVGRSLASFVEEVTAPLPSWPNQIVWHDFSAWQFQTDRPEFPAAVNRLDLQIVDDNPKLELWAPRCAYMVPHLSADTVQARISSKSRQVPDYLRNCAEVWMLIVVDTGLRSIHFEIDEELLATEFITSFSRVFLLRSVHTELFELKVHSLD